MKHFSAGTRPSKQLCRTTKHPYGGTGRIFGDGCANREYYAGTGFRANRRERTSGPDEGGGTAKQKDGVCPTTLDRAYALTKRRSSPSSNRVGQTRPFPTSARRPAVAGPKVRSNKPEGLQWQGIRYVTTSPNKSRYCSRPTFRA